MDAQWITAIFYSICHFFLCSKNVKRRIALKSPEITSNHQKSPKSYVERIFVNISKKQNKLKNRDKIYIIQHTNTKTDPSRVEKINKYMKMDITLINRPNNSVYSCKSFNLIQSRADCFHGRSFMILCMFEMNLWPWWSMCHLMSNCINTINRKIHFVLLNLFTNFAWKKQQNKKKILEKNDKLRFSIWDFYFQIKWLYKHIFGCFFFYFLRKNKKERMQFIGALANEKM